MPVSLFLHAYMRCPIDSYVLVSVYRVLACFIGQPSALHICFKTSCQFVIVSSTNVYTPDPVLDMACFACPQPVDFEVPSNGSIGCEFGIYRGFSSSLNDFHHIWAHIVCGVLTF